MSKKKFSCLDCPYYNECYDAQAYGYCPKIDYGDEDIGTATVKEMRKQNNEY